MARVLNDVSENFFQPCVNSSAALTPGSRRAHSSSSRRVGRASGRRASVGIGFRTRESQLAVDSPIQALLVPAVFFRCEADRSEERPLLTDYHSINDPTIRVRVPSAYPPSFPLTGREEGDARQGRAQGLVRQRAHIHRLPLDGRAPLHDRDRPPLRRQGPPGAVVCPRLRDNVSPRPARLTPARPPHSSTATCCTRSA